MNRVYTKKERMKLGLLGILLHFLMLVTIISCGLDPLIMVGKLIWHDMLFGIIFCVWMSSYLMVMTCMICAIDSRLPHVVSLVLFVMVVSFATMTAPNNINLASTLSDKVILGTAVLCWIGNPWIIWHDFRA